MDENSRREYWRKNVRLLVGLLAVWAIVGFGAGILFADALNGIEIMGFPLGFWFAQQGSILVFLALIGTYVWRMDKLDAEFGLDGDEEIV